MGIDEILKDKRDEVLRVAAKHGARNVRIFGSVARGEGREESDLDLLVDVGIATVRRSFRAAWWRTWKSCSAAVWMWSQRTDFTGTSVNGS